MPIPRRARTITILAAAAAAALPCGQRLAVRLHDRRVERRIDLYSETIWHHARENALPTGLVRSVIREESGGDPAAVSPAGAVGLMQVTRIAEEEVLGGPGAPGGDLSDPDYNVSIGTRYLRQLIDSFSGDVLLALAAYHAGPTRIDELCLASLGKDAVLENCPRATASYCRRVLGGKSPLLSPHTRVREANSELSP